MKQTGVYILISDKIVFKPVLIRRDREGHSKIIKGKIHKKEIIFLNFHVPNMKASKFIKETKLQPKSDIDLNIVIAGDLSTPLALMNRSFGQKLNQKLWI